MRHQRWAFQCQRPREDPSINAQL